MSSERKALISWIPVLVFPPLLVYFYFVGFQDIENAIIKKAKTEYYYYKDRQFFFDLKTGQEDLISFIKKNAPSVLDVEVTGILNGQIYLSQEDLAKGYSEGIISIEFTLPKTEIPPDRNEVYLLLAEGINFDGRSLYVSKHVVSQSGDSHLRYQLVFEKMSS